MRARTRLVVEAMMLSSWVQADREHALPGPPMPVRLRHSRQEESICREYSYCYYRRGGLRGLAPMVRALASSTFHLASCPSRRIGYIYFVAVRAEQDYAGKKHPLPSYPVRVSFVTNRSNDL